MRRLLPLLLAVAALAAYAIPISRILREDGTDRTVDAGETNGGAVLLTGQSPTRLRPTPCSAGVCTRAVPDAGTEGMILAGVASWWLDVCAPQVDQTLVPDGAVCEFWRLNPVTSEWAWVSEKDKKITQTTHCQGFPVVLNDMRGDGVRGLYRCNGITVSGVDGGTLKTTMAACTGAQAGGCGGAP